MAIYRTYNAQADTSILSMCIAAYQLSRAQFHNARIIDLRDELEAAGNTERYA